ncbi:glutamine synthetase family protein [Actinoplanes solisilvae]|uniref:glutamine synthetase family protein n=1 Tax=Actinoplanes solisilvae TaxID=2486853 RepID=UPI000FDC4457|nr:glutamine synthetase family protein [Actinoplanes solisilvae]
MRGVNGVILSYVDTAGINRVKTVPAARLDDAVRDGVGISPVFDVFLSDDSSVATDRLGGPDGDLRLRPDLSRFVPLAAQPGWGWAPTDRFTQDGEPWIADQRGFARRAVSRAAAAGLTFRMAIEIEWVVGRDTDDFEPGCRGPAYGMSRVVELSDYLRDLLTALDDQDVRVEQLHPEYAAGQFEVSVAANDPVGAADDSVLVRQTIRAVSHRHGLRVSFSPAVEAGTVGNGGHVHLSAWRGDENLFAGGVDFPDGGRGAGFPGGAGRAGFPGGGGGADFPGGAGRAGFPGGGGGAGFPGGAGFADGFPGSEGGLMAGGILAHLRALLAVGAPTPASYLRLVPSRWAGAFACWGVETREAALRYVPSPANLEVKCFDLTANPYLLVGALIAAALDSHPLPSPVTGDPVRLPDAPRLPASLDEAVDAFVADDVLREALGPVLADGIAAVRRGEVARFRDATPPQIAAALRWVY